MASRRASLTGVCLAVATGCIAWMLWLSGRSPTNPAAFFGLLAAVSFLLGIFRLGHSLWSGFGLIAAPFLMAPVTVSKGDGDGLWVLIFPMLLGWGAILAGLYRLGSSRTEYGALSRLPRAVRSEAGRIVTLALMIVLASGAVLVSISVWPNPWARLVEWIDRFEMTSGGETLRIVRAGDALCDSSCGPRVIGTVRMPSGGNPCEVARNAFVEWAGEPEISFGPCAVKATRPDEELGRVILSVQEAEGNELTDLMLVTAEATD